MATLTHFSIRFLLRFAMLLVACAAVGEVPPGSNFDLSHWKLTLPIDDAGGTTGEAAEVKNPVLRTYSSQFFYAGADGAMVFWCPVVGAMTTSATAPRSELRELISGNDSTVNWTAMGTHVLRGQCRVTQQPDTGAVIIGQVHGYPVQRLVKVQYDNGRVQAYVRNSLTLSGDTKFTYNVGTTAPINYEIKVVDGVAIIAVNGVTNSHNFGASDPAWLTSAFYFKAGAYLQDKSGPETEGGRVSFYQLSVVHGTPGTSPSITAQPVSQALAQGTSATLTVGASGTAPLLYQWFANGVACPGGTNASLLLTNLRASDQKDYTVIVSNSGGSATSAVASLYLNAPLRFLHARGTNGRLSALLLGAAGSSYVLQYSSNLVTWLPLATNSSPAGIISFSATNVPGGRRYFRARTL